MSRLPEEHTLSADDLRRVHWAIEVLAHFRQTSPVTDAMGSVIDSVVERWEPVREEMARQHVAHQENVVPMRRAGGGEPS